ncbi:MAG: DRTGG domain-containing protein [Alkaliphilus sp.]
MKLKEIQKILEAKVLTGEKYLDNEIKTAFACDLMSDALTFKEDKTLLLTGLVNPHTIRTAEMMDIGAIVFVRGKNPDEATIKLAKEVDIVIMTTENILFTCSGILFTNGIKGAELSCR